MTPVMCKSFFSLLCLVLLTECGGEPWRSITVPAGTPIEAVLKLKNPYTPFNREMLLLETPEESTEFGDCGEDCFYHEFVGRHGRIRVYTALSEGVDVWLELLPSRLYLNDVVNPAYIKEFELSYEDTRGSWKLSISPEDKLWYLTLELDNTAVVKLIEPPPPPP